MCFGILLIGCCLLFIRLLLFERVTRPVSTAREWSMSVDDKVVVVEVGRTGEKSATESKGCRGVVDMSRATDKVTTLERQ